jgi:hypothetical protein
MTEECRVYLSPHDESIFCLVSPIDYEWCLQWKWQFTWDRHKVKKYATRSTTGPGKVRRKIYLHKAILSERMGAIPPSAKHTIGDHGDSESLNNVRGNLEWVTPKQNAERKRSKRWRHLPEPANDNTIELEKAA